MISICWVSRNDNHGDHLLPRIQAAIDALDYYIHSTGASLELIFVEWNPPPSTPPLRSVLDMKSVRTRWYIVSPSIHNLFPLSSRLPIFQHIGCNIGLVRAQGDWFLTTTHDCIWSPSLADSLADDFLLDETCFYRATRCDCEANASTPMDTPERIRYMNHHILRHRLWKRGVFTKACGDFILARTSAWKTIRGYPEWRMSGQHLDGLLLYFFLAIGLNQFVFGGHNYHMEHGDRATNQGLPSSTIPFLPWQAYKSMGEKALHAHSIPEINPASLYGMQMAKERQIEYNVWELYDYHLYDIIPWNEVSI